MKPILLAFLLSVSAITGYAQKNTLFGLYVGGGLASSDNYDVALSGGLDYAVGLNTRSFVGLEAFYQQYSLLYDNEANSARKGVGYAGEILRHSSSYFFLAPKFRYCAGKYQNTHIYFDAGIGFNTSGFDSVRRWSTQSTPGGLVRTDTTLDQSENINSMVLRIGVGITQYLYFGRNWRFTVTADFGFLPGSLTDFSGTSDVARTAYSVNAVNPAYISLRFGLSRTKNR